MNQSLRVYFGWAFRSRMIALGAFAVLSAVPCHANGPDLYKKAIAAEKANNVDEALRFYSAAVEAGDLSNAQLAVTHKARASLWAKLCENGRAMADFSKCIELDPMNGASYSLRGYLRGLSGQYDLAEKDQLMALKLTEGVKWKDYVPWVQQHHADLWRRRGEFEKALKICEQALQKSDYATIYFRRAWIHLDRKDYTSAKTDFETFQRATEKQVHLDLMWPDERIAYERLKRNAEREP